MLRFRPMPLRYLFGVEEWVQHPWKPKFYSFFLNFVNYSSFYFKSNVHNFDNKSRCSLVSNEMASTVFLVLSEDNYTLRHLVVIHQSHPEVISVNVSRADRELGRQRYGSQEANMLLTRVAVIVRVACVGQQGDPQDTGSTNHYVDQR